MRPTTGTSPELWVGDIQEKFGIEPRVVQEYWSKRYKIVRPMRLASKQGGRHVYGRREIVELLMSKQLAESGMLLEEIERVMAWLGEKTVKLARYPDDPASFRRYADSGEFAWTSGDPRGEQEGWWRDVTFDPVPSAEIAAEYYGKIRGYPDPPTRPSAWSKYWGSVAQFILIDRYTMGLTSLQVLIPLRWLQSEQGRFKRIHRWFNLVMGDVAFEPVLVAGHASLTTVRMVDIAQIKKHVVDVLLSTSQD